MKSSELAVFRVTAEGLVLDELQEGVDFDTVKEKTEASFTVNSAIF
jgi:acetate CoA/acetoacetate CoA-transferase beta subunit